MRWQAEKYHAKAQLKHLYLLVSTTLNNDISLFSSGKYRHPEVLYKPSPDFVFLLFPPKETQIPAQK